MVTIFLIAASRLHFFEVRDSMISKTIDDGSCKFDICEIVKNKSMVVHFQPIVSESRKTVIGVEGLIRGLTESNQIISPRELFDAAYAQNLTLELDRICREKVLGAYSEINRQFPDKLLFINLETSILGKCIGSDYLLRQTQQYKLNPGNIVIEVNESRAQNTAALKRFTDVYREYGFRVALDDVGTGFSNMDRIILIKPDIIKIDISLVRNIHADYYKQGVFKSLVNLSNKIGALVVVEGVETNDEAIQVLKLGAHMIQGYFIAKPIRSVDANLFSNETIELLSHNFNKDVKLQIQKNKKENNRMNKLINECIKELVPVSFYEFDPVLKDFIKSRADIECAYVLDKNGIQVNSTIYRSEQFERNQDLLFFAAKAGTDHSMKKYYYTLASADLKRYITEPYISLATGNLCTTISKVFSNSENREYILCIDFWTKDDSSITEFRKDYGMHSTGFDSSSDINSVVSRLNHEIYSDALTGVYNRRFIEERLLVDIFNASYARQPISILLADIDFFKRINDTYGHLAGDQILKDFAEVIQNNIRRKLDWVARYGGEEFLIVLFNSDEKVAFNVAEKIRKAIAAKDFRYKNQVIRLTASFGANTVHSDAITYEQIIDKADKSLYFAKNDGRNKTVCLQS